MTRGSLCRSGWQASLIRCAERQLARNITLRCHCPVTRWERWRPAGAAAAGRLFVLQGTHAGSAGILPALRPVGTSTVNPGLNQGRPCENSEGGVTVLQEEMSIDSEI